jgi:hypothetical protein
MEWKPTDECVMLINIEWGNLLAYFCFLRNLAYLWYFIASLRIYSSCWYPLSHPFLQENFVTWYLSLQYT